MWTAGGFRVPRGIVLGVVWGALLSCVGCQDGYPIPASQCDEWCDASQLAICSPYDPAGCVVDCVRRGGDATECQAEHAAAVACLRAATSEELACTSSRYDGSNVRPCDAQQTEYEDCSTAHANGYGSRGWY